MKEDAWQEIEKKLGIAAPECKQKIITILASRRREKMKIKKSSGTGKGTKDIYKSKRFAFEALNFLMDRDKPRQGLTTQDTANSEATTNNQNPDIGSASEIPPPKKAKQDIKLKMLKKAFGILKESVNKPPATNENDRELQSFFNFIIKKMKKYSAHTKTTVQQEIFQIISRADQGYYDNATQYGYYSQQNNPTQPINLQSSQYPTIPTTATTSVSSVAIEQPSPSTSHVM
ncbi:hypothetical protein EVAR_65931_1 [Eumeta japonica]|uniref:Uncharacterized protein n=1 Tax=Eumeta variegata TaxID=151549 RepID=A0A4C2AD10_EUMVA|nr:hypothetical protein EVAR_65931_1 [Eumeta japonica]